MPQVKIKERDRTQTPVGEYANFAVAVPGVLGFDDQGNACTGIYEDGTSVFDDNGIYECSSQADFIKYIGYHQGVSVDVEESESEEEEESETPTELVQIGNQIAYELLGLGYPVLYKKFETLSELNNWDFWEPLTDKANYDFRFVISGLFTNSDTAAEQIDKVVHRNDPETGEDTAPGRGDAAALLDIDETVYNTSSNRANRSKLFEDIRDAANDLIAGKYSAIFAPSVCLLGTSSKYTNTKFPASFYYLACFKNALDNGFAEWYAAAGYTRGVCKYTIEAADVNFGEYFVNQLEPRNNANNLTKAVNVITKIRNNYYLWGNRTAFALGEELKASHFLNIRQLCSTIKKQLYYACKRFTFDPNSDVLWINFCNAIAPTLEKMKADQGIKDYKIVKVYTAKKAELKAKIRIIPIEAVEDFDLEISLEDNFGNALVTTIEK